ncbi:MAG: nuclear transport factor 2 family protein [Solirubrobacterales bacterium]
MTDREQLAHGFLTAWNDRDWTALERLCHPVIVIQAPEGWPETGEFHGWAAVRAQWERLKEPFDDDRVEYLDVEDLDDETMLTHTRWRGTGASGLEMDLEAWLVIRFRGDLLIRVEYYFDEAKAREAA